MDYLSRALSVRLSGKRIPPPLSVSKLILIRFAMTCDEEGISSASNKDLSAFCEATPRKIFLGLKYLKREGFISDVFRSDGKKIGTKIIRSML